jgi:hypothetical protein
MTGGCPSRDHLGNELMANGLKPPTPKHSSWMAYAIVFPLLAGALLTSPVWATAHGVRVGMRAFRAASRKLQDGNRRRLGGLEARPR